MKKFTTSLIISIVTLIIGLVFSKPYLLIVFLIVVASVVDLLTRKWCFSDRIGQWKNLSVFLKFFLQLIGLFAMVGQFLCLYFLVKWFIL